MLLANMRQYGKIFTVSFGRMPTLVIADSEVLKIILVKQFDSFTSRSDSAKAPPPIDSSLFAATGEQWKRIRGILSPSFTSGKMKQMVPLMEDAVAVLMTNLAEVANTGTKNDCKIMRCLSPCCYIESLKDVTVIFLQITTTVVLEMK